jgi:putative hemolysin
MKLVIILLTPITFFLDIINKSFFFIFRIKKPKKAMITEDELIAMIRIGAEQGTIKQREKEFINNIFKFDNIKAKEVMTPRNYTTAIEVNSPVEEVLEIINESEYSRIPVYKKRLDHIKGVLYAKDLLYLISKKSKTIKISKIMKPAIFVPGNMKIDKIFRLMQNKNTHIVFVVNEYGGVSGIITLEDLLEELVGEIYDESDEKKENIKKINSKEYLVEGITPLEEINEKLKTDLTAKEEYLTISGFILEKLGRMPKEQEIIEHDKLKIKIMKLAKRRIISLKIIKED